MPDYPSNISRTQFALIQPDLENFRKHTRPRRYDLYLDCIIKVTTQKM